jgi:hypothetical protein
MLECEDRHKLIDVKFSEGKHWVSVAYAYRKYLWRSRDSKKDVKNGMIVGHGRTITTGRREASSQASVKDETGRENEDVAIVFIVSPTLIGIWSDFLKERVDEEVLSTHTSSCFYQRAWRSQMKHYRVFVVSQKMYLGLAKRLVDEGIDIVAIQDAVHQATAMTGREIEHVGLTTRLDTMSPKDLDGKAVIELNDVDVMKSVPQEQYEWYPYCGYSKDIVESLRTLACKKTFRLDEIHMKVFENALSFGWLVLPSSPITVKVERKLLHTYTSANAGMPAENDKVLAMLKKSPKLMAIVALAKELAERKESLIVFDTDTSSLIHLHLLFASQGLNVFTFCTLYNPAGRTILLQRFRKEGGVLIGSIPMLCEGHDLSFIRHITFARYPHDVGSFRHAISRCRKVGQEYPVRVHMLMTSALEKKIVAKMEGKAVLNIDVLKDLDAMLEV